MIPSARRRGRAWLLTGMLAPAALGAQERITLRAAPAPMQVIHLSMTQDLAFDIAMDDAGLRPLKLEGQLTLAGTERVGERDGQGRVTAELKVDEVALDTKLNGVTRPTPDAVAQLRGQSFTVVYDGQGKVVDVTAPAGLGEAGVNAKNMISSLAESIPSATLGVGETITVPIRVPLPLPIPGAENGPPTMLDSKTTSKLVGIVREGPDRIAVLEQTAEGTASRALDMPTPSGPVAATLELHMTGSGSMQLNVDKGFVKSGSNDMKLDMTILMQGMTMKANGTIHMVVTGTAQPAQ